MNIAGLKHASICFQYNARRIGLIWQENSMALVIDILIDSSRPEIFRKMCSVWAMFTGESARDKIKYNTVDFVICKVQDLRAQIPKPIFT